MTSFLGITDATASNLLAVSQGVLTGEMWRVEAMRRTVTLDQYRELEGRARLIDEEWLADAVSERWVRETYHDVGSQREWDQRHPYLSGLIAHLLAVLEGTDEPLNDNIADWESNGSPREIIL